MFGNAKNIFILGKFIQICPTILKMCGNPNLRKAPQVHRVAKMAFTHGKGPTYFYIRPQRPGAFFRLGLPYTLSIVGQIVYFHPI